MRGQLCLSPVGFAFRALLVLLTCLPLSQLSQAQDISVTAEIDPNPASTDDQISLTVKVSGPGGGGETPPAPKVEGLRLVAGPSISRSFQWINGQSSASQSFTYVFEAEKEGSFRIPAIPVKVAGKIYQTKEMYVKVAKDAGGGQRSVPRRRSPFSVFDDMGLGEDSPLRDRTPRRTDVFTVAEVDKRTVYVGEQVTLIYKVLTQIPVVQVELKENPPLSGFWSEEIELPKTPEAHTRVINGKQYAEYVVKKQALFPTKSGALEIPASAFVLVIRTTSGGLFSFPSQDTVLRKTDPVSIKVQPLPETGKPADFDGAVGDFKLEALLDKNKAETGEALNLTIKLSGAGNLRTIAGFPLPELPGFKIYSSKSRDEVGVRDNVFQGTKIWDYVIVPQAPGKESVPELKFRYFSPQAQRYLEARASGLEVAVVQGKGGMSEPSGTFGFAQQSIVKRGNDINYIKLPGGALQDRSRRLYQSYWLYAFMLLPFFCNAGILIYQSQQVRQLQDAKGFRSRRARKVAEKRLAQASRSLRQNEFGQFHSTLLASVTGYLSDKFILPQIEITSQQIQRFMEEKKIEPLLVEEVVSVLEECNFAKYAPVQLEHAKLAHLLEKAKSVIEQIEKAT